MFRFNIVLIIHLKEALLVVSPFATNGDLKSYLRSTHEQGEYANVLSNAKCLRDIDIAEQVVDGMIYLCRLSQVRPIHSTFLHSVASQIGLYSYLQVIWCINKYFIVYEEKFNIITFNDLKVDKSIIEFDSLINIVQL